MTKRVTGQEKRKKVRVAIIDSGFYAEKGDLGNTGDPFLGNENVEARVIQKKNFLTEGNDDPSPHDWTDRNGHGTQVARLVLMFAPQAEVVIAKVTDLKTMKNTKVDQLVRALRWAHEEAQADIINLSFSLGTVPIPEVQDEIDRLILNQKLVFAAASNTGGYGGRSWPASAPGVFAIHAADQFGKTTNEINPSPYPDEDNFATFGYKVVSYWDGSYRSISGTSFATPVAAAIAANVLDIARRRLAPNVSRAFTRYGAMSALFRGKMARNGESGGYHCCRPWAEGLGIAILRKRIFTKYY